MVTNTTVGMELVETGEKRDRLGRKITPEGRRAELVAAWRQSGRTQAEFARAEGLNYTTFVSWVQADREQSAAAPKRKPVAVRFAEVRLPEAAGAVLEVKLADGTVVRGGNARALAELLKALRS